MFDSISRKLSHFWHLVCDVRPIYWITLYLCLVPLFAFFYWLLPDNQFRIPEAGGANFGDWIYYSIVTITTLGFGDYTPCAPGSQCITAIEVICGMVTIGFFLNAVGAMRSEIDLESELEKQRLIHQATEKEKLDKSTSVLIFRLNQFLSYCYAVTTPLDKRTVQLSYNPDFTAADMTDMNKPSGLPDDYSENRSALSGLMKTAGSLSLFLDSLQGRIDLTLWPDLLEDCFAFVANYQMLSIDDDLKEPNDELIHFIKTDASLARDMEIILTKISSQNPITTAQNS